MTELDLIVTESHEINSGRWCWRVSGEDGDDWLEGDDGSKGQSPCTPSYIKSQQAELMGLCLGATIWLKLLPTPAGIRPMLSIDKYFL